MDDRAARELEQLHVGVGLAVFLGLPGVGQDLLLLGRVAQCSVGFGGEADACRESCDCSCRMMG